MWFLEPSARSPFKHKQIGPRPSLLVCGQAAVVLTPELCHRAAPATVGKIDSTAAPFKKCDFSRFAASRLCFNKERRLSLEFCSHYTARGRELSGRMQRPARTRTSGRTVQATSKRLREQLCAASGDEGECIILLQPDTSSLTETLLILLPFITHHL